MSLPTVLAGALLESAASLLDRGIHPIKIADGFDKACDVAVKELDRVGDKIEFSKEDTTELLKVAQTSMGSKMLVLRILVPQFPFVRASVESTNDKFILV